MKKVENKQLPEDINGLKNRLNELESLFLESQRQRSRLLVDYNNKIDAINIVENDIAKEKGTYYRISMHIVVILLLLLPPILLLLLLLLTLTLTLLLLLILLLLSLIHI